ncbi:Exodeoxyribonuclease VII small subunit [Ruminococcaceae bacterium YRB3002]|nr:Exodeoxyribonuclease VII small subunit [Ruminococcaceae bacterium YRB3002]
MEKIDENMTFEQAMSELNNTVKKLSEGKCTLDESLEYYKYGTSLVKFCNDKLNEVKQQIEVINTANGTTSPVDM